MSFERGKAGGRGREDGGQKWTVLYKTKVTFIQSFYTAHFPDGYLIPISWAEGTDPGKNSSHVGSSAISGRRFVHIKADALPPQKLPVTLVLDCVFITSTRNMTHLQLEPSLLDTLAGKVAVLTGGATGIGRSTVQLLCSEFALAEFNTSIF